MSAAGPPDPAAGERSALGNGIGQSVPPQQQSLQVLRDLNSFCHYR
jgi:hypothetical protein